MEAPRAGSADVRTVGVILNPTAGGGRALRLLPRVVAALRRLEQSHEIHVTGAAGEAVDVAGRFASAGVHTVVAVGGDGTVNEVANGLLDSGLPTALGVVPAGRGADFSRSLEMPRELDVALARIVRGTRRRIDVGRAAFADGTTRAFVNVAGLGFDATVAERAARSRLPGSTIPYLHGLLGTLVGYQNLPVALRADGTAVAGRALSVVIANGSYFGGGMRIVPGARLDDGRLDLTILGDLSKVELLRNVPRVYSGTHVTHPKFVHRTIERVHVESGESARVQLDGEVVASTPVTFSVVPGALVLAG